MKMTKKYRQPVHTFLRDSIWLHVFYNKHTCREMSPGLDAPREAGSFPNLPRGTSEVSWENFQQSEVRPIWTHPTYKCVSFLSHATSIKMYRGFYFIQYIISRFDRTF